MLVSVPLLGYPSLPAAALAGKTVLDTGNYYPQRDGQIAALDAGSLTDSEYLARHLPGARVVKVFNNIFFKHLQNLARPADRARPRDRTYLPVAGGRCRGEAFRRRVPRLDRVRRGRRRDRSPIAGGSSRGPRSTGPRTASSRTRRAPRRARRDPGRARRRDEDVALAARAWQAVPRWTFRPGSPGGLCARGTRVVVAASWIRARPRRLSRSRAARPAAAFTPGQQAVADVAEDDDDQRHRQHDGAEGVQRGAAVAAVLGRVDDHRHRGVARA